MKPRGQLVTRAVQNKADLTGLVFFPLCKIKSDWLLKSKNVTLCKDLFQVVVSTGQRSAQKRDRVAGWSSRVSLGTMLGKK